MANTSEKLSTFLRIRPVNCENKPYSVTDSSSLYVSMADPSKNCIYKFSHIFDYNSDQCEVFNKCCSPLVDDLINNNDSLLFSYGTTASGKSYTMKGTCDNPGLIPQALTKLFDININEAEQ